MTSNDSALTISAGLSQDNTINILGSQQPLVIHPMRMMESLKVATLNILVYPYSNFLLSHADVERTIALRNILSSAKVEHLTTDVDMEINCETTVSPKVLYELINEKTTKESKELTKEIIKLHLQMKELKSSYSSPSGKLTRG